jgi:hypothetical protein
MDTRTNFTIRGLIEVNVQIGDSTERARLARTVEERDDQSMRMLDLALRRWRIEERLMREKAR